MDSFTFAIKFTKQYIDIRVNNDFEFYATLQQLAIFALAVILLRARKLVKDAVVERRIGKRAAKAAASAPDLSDDWA